jgi:hypothetical protein
VNSVRSANVTRLVPFNDPGHGAGTGKRKLRQHKDQRERFGETFHNVLIVLAAMSFDNFTDADLKNRSAHYRNSFNLLKPSPPRGLPASAQTSRIWCTAVI